MKNKSIALFALSAALLISGCNTGTPAETSAITEEAATTTTAEVTTPASTTTAAAITTTAGTEEPVLGDTIIGMDGVVVDRPVEQMGKPGATFDTFTFYRESTGLIFTDDSYYDLNSEWKKAVPGDRFGSLTVSSVSAVYDPVYGQNTEDHSLGEYYAWSRRVMSLDGTVTLSGILYADADEQAFWGKCLFFQPTARSLAENNFPTLIPISCCFSSDPYYRTDTHEDTQEFYVGNIDDFADVVDWSLYTDEDNIIEVYAEVELTGIKISYNTGTGASNEGEAEKTKIIRVSSDRNDITASEPTVTDTEEEWHLEPFYDPEIYDDPGFMIVGTTPKVFEIPAECNGEPVNRIYFRGTCDNLKTEKLILPDTLEYIQPDPNWRSLTEICVSENNSYLSADDGILYSKDKSVLYMYPSGRENVEFTVPDFVSSIAKGAFENALYLKKITIPDTVLDIRSQAFRDSVLEEISLENAVETIGAGAFWACRKLKKIEIPASVRAVGDDCFYGCDNLETVIIDGDPERWGDDVFCICFALKEVILSGAQKRICYDNGVLVNKNDAGEIVSVIRALPDTCPESYEMPKTAKRIDAHAFYGCKSLKTVVFPAEIDYEPMDGFVPYEGFIGCDNIREVYVYSDKFRYSGGQMFPKGTIIYTYKGYPAAERAEEHGFKVVYLDEQAE